MTRIGALFAGYGGLELGVQTALGGTVAWHSEIDPDASRILAHHWPDMPNLGDITKVDWSNVEPVDIITGGSPCQDVSSAGKRQGMRAGTRSGLWASMVDAIDVLRPRLVVWENVRGVLSAEADSAMEPCPGCVGGPDDGPVLRALGRVLGDLSELGYDAQWYGLRAADVGAPHGRFRVFVVAQPADFGQERGRPARDGRTGPANLGSATPADTDHDSVRQQPVTEPGRGSAALAGLAGADVAPDAQGQGWQGSRSEPPRGGPERGGGAAADTDDGRRWISQDDGAGQPDAEGSSGGHPGERSGTAWGPYGPAIERWERVLGRVAPAPTESAPKGGQRLSPRFVEWMQGLPAGHVTDPAIGISRNAQLKALGNGVVPQQAAAAVRFLINVAERAA